MLLFTNFVKPVKDKYGFWYRTRIHKWLSIMDLEFNWRMVCTGGSNVIKEEIMRLCNRDR